ILLAGLDLPEIDDDKTGGLRHVRLLLLQSRSEYGGLLSFWLPAGLIAQHALPASCGSCKAKPALAIYQIIDTFLLIMQFAIIGRAILSWFDRSGQNPVSQVLIQLTEPIIAPIRQIMPRTGMIDLAPMVSIFAIIILRQILATAAAG
ncbi:MAG TPA: YggT family protein, partial [Chloroflexota bacterium]|nr:YggT family protein [Chloroflexota bacterium]